MPEPRDEDAIPTQPLGATPKHAKFEKSITCGRCGLEYAAGAPHSQFCRGNVPEGSRCCECKDDDQDFLSECRTCGEIVCDCCKEDGNHECL